MAPFLDKLELFVSICGPHLGALYSKNNLVDAGVGFLKMMNKGGAGGGAEGGAWCAEM